jgi:hypothetical protein
VEQSCCTSVRYTSERRSEEGKEGAVLNRPSLFSLLTSCRSSLTSNERENDRRRVFRLRGLRKMGTGDAGGKRSRSNSDWPVIGQDLNSPGRKEKKGE